MGATRVAARQLQGLLFGLAVGLGCGGGGGSGSGSDSGGGSGSGELCGPDPFPAAGVDGAYYGVETTLPGGPHVLFVEENEARVDGVSATLRMSGATARVEYDDDVGRNVVLSLCTNTSSEGHGVVERCADSTCERGDLNVLPLTLHPAANATRADYTLLGEFHDPAWPDGPTVDLTVGDGFAVLARGADGLRFIATDTDSEQAMKELAHLQTSEDDFYNDVKLLDDRYVLVASRNRGLLTVDASDPRRPQVVSQDLPLARPQGHNLFVRGEVAYLARSRPGGGIAVIDVSDPASPVLVDTHRLPGCDDVHDLYVTGHDGAELAYVNCIDAGLLVFDLDSREVLSQYEQPFSHSIAVATTRSADTLIFSSEAFSSHVQVASWDRERGFTPLSHLNHRSAAAIHNIACTSARCFVSAYQEGWFELDVSEPSAPLVLSQIGTWRGPGARFLEGASGIARRDDHVFVADTERGLLVYQPSAQ